MKTFFFVWFVLMLIAVVSHSNKHVKYKTVTMQKVINLGNYESQRLEITVEIESDDEDYLSDCLLELNATLSDALTKFKEQHHFGDRLEDEQKKSSLPPWS